MTTNCKSVGSAFAGSSPARPTLLTSEGATVMLQSVSLRVITPVVWLEAPGWLTPAEASYLSGYDVETVRWLAEDGGFDTRDDGLIDKASIREFQEALLEVLHWRDG